MHQEFQEHFNNHIAQKSESIPAAPVLPEQKKDLQSEKRFVRPFDARFGAPDFISHPMLKENSELRLVQEKEEAKKNIEKILFSGNLEEIIRFLQEEKNEDDVFLLEIERVKKEYASELSSATFLNEKDWKILTALEIFDKGTFEHSVRTYLIAKEKLETRLTDLGHEIEAEGVILKQFYVACLFHDIGKLSIPKFILNSVIHDNVWTHLFMELPHEQQDEILTDNFLPVPDEYRNDHEKLHAFFEENEFRAVSAVPIGEAYTKPEEVAIMKERNIDVTLSLTKIMEPHEKNSKYILKKIGYGLEAILAGSHHSYNANDDSYEMPISISALQLGVQSAIMHFADLEDALSSDRSYGEKKPFMRKINIMLKHANEGNLPMKQVAASWINDDLKEISREDLLAASEYLKSVNNFLAEHIEKKEALYSNEILQN